MALLLRIVCVLAFALTLHVACAQSYPSKPIRIVVGFPPGGGIDLVARLLSPKLTDSLGQQVVVDNRAGVNGIIATELAAIALPDGHTILIGTTGNLSVNPALYPNLPFNIERDFVPLTQTSSVPSLLYIHPSLSARTLFELIALAKAPGEDQLLLERQWRSSTRNGQMGRRHQSCEYTRRLI